MAHLCHKEHGKKHMCQKHKNKGVFDMLFDDNLKSQLISYAELIEDDIVLRFSVGNDELSVKLMEILNAVAEVCPKISLQKDSLERTPSFVIDRARGASSGISFAGLPLGEEFASFIMAVIQTSGRKPKIDDDLISQIKSINQKLNFTTYVSLTCNNCPDVVQALNIMAVLNDNITHVMVDGSAFKDEVEEKEVLAVPSIFLNGEYLMSGRQTLETILAKIGVSASADDLSTKDPFDVLVVGGGPAGAAAAIYAARKGIRTGLVADTLGGQVVETLAIENIIGTKYTEGAKFMAQVHEHVKEYEVDIMTGQYAQKIERKNEMVELTLESGAILQTKTAILATGARWRDLNIPGEKEFKNKGIAYCPHCDGPLFKGKDVAVIGGGNSGVEAAIDLAGVVNHVTLLEFAPELKADMVLQNRLKSLTNVTILTNVLTEEIKGESKVSSLVYENRIDGTKNTIDVEGVFILIGLVPNTEWLGTTLEKTKHGEIIVDKHGATSMQGVFAAGDCTDSAYKQIVISIGSGATAALGAFDYIIRN